MCSESCRPGTGRGISFRATARENSPDSNVSGPGLKPVKFWTKTVEKMLANLEICFTNIPISWFWGLQFHVRNHVTRYPINHRIIFHRVKKSPRIWRNWNQTRNHWNSELTKLKNTKVVAILVSVKKRVFFTLSARLRPPCLSRHPLKSAPHVFIFSFFRT